MNQNPLRIIFMGVCGCGKTTLAAKTAEMLECRVIEADEFHTPEMKEKMRAGIPLTDSDRWPWLDKLNNAMKNNTQPWSVITCSALKKVYRERLAEGLNGNVHFIFLDASKDVIRDRMTKRVHEYMPVSLLDSQFATLERPTQDEPVSTVSVESSEDDALEQIRSILDKLRMHS
jgi:gluconokinase